MRAESQRFKRGGRVAVLSNVGRCSGVRKLPTGVAFHDKDSVDGMSGLSHPQCQACLTGIGPGPCDSLRAPQRRVRVGGLCHDNSPMQRCQAAPGEIPGFVFCPLPLGPGGRIVNPTVDSPKGRLSVCLERQHPQYVLQEAFV